MRQRKSWASSVELGALKPATRTLIGLRPPRQCLTVPSLPEASMPCSTTSTERLCSAMSIVASSAMRSARLAVRARAVFSSRRPSLRVGRMRRRGRPWSRGRCASRGRDPASRGRYATALGERDAARRARRGSRTDRRRTRAPARAGRRRAASRNRPRRAGEQAPRAPSASRTAQAGCALVAGGERLADAHVELLRPAAEPAAAARCERRGLLELGQAEQAAVERARRPRGRGARPPARDRCR